MALPSVVIIGAGVGGLVAGNLLTKKGYDVTIFEKHATPGGYTAGFRRKGFYFESGTLSFELGSSIFAAMSDLGLDGKINFVKQKERWISEDFDFHADSYDNFKDLVYQSYGKEHDKLTKYFQQVDGFCEAAHVAGKARFPFLYSGKEFFPAMDDFMAHQKKFILLSLQHPETNAEDFTSRFFDPQTRLFTLLTKHHGYPKMGIDAFAGCLTLFEDYWTVKEGMQAWADALAAKFAERGGRLFLKSPVKTIITNNNKAVGVQVDDTVFNADWVISASDYKRTFTELLDDKLLLNKKLTDRLMKAEMSEGFFTVYLGLNMTNEELKRHMKTHYVVSFEEQYCTDKHEMRDEDFFSRSMMSLYSPSLLSPDHAPAGKSSLMILAMAPRRWMGNWGGGEPERYRYLKEKAALQLIKKAERIIPGLTGSIAFQDAATPLTYERFTSNSEGATCAWSWNPKSRFYTRSTGIFVETPINNLLIGSAWAMQRGGVPGAVFAAYMCSKKISARSGDGV